MKTQKLSSVDLTPLVEKKQLFGVKKYKKKVQVRLSKANSALKLACCYIKYLQNKKISQLLTYFSQPKLSQGCLLFFRSRVWLLISSCLYKNCLLLFYIWKVKTGKNFLLYMESSGNCQKHLPVFTTLLYFLRIYDIVPSCFFKFHLS